jgi:hypothetical protein
VVTGSVGTSSADGYRRDPSLNVCLRVAILYRGVSLRGHSLL